MGGACSNCSDACSQAVENIAEHRTMERPLPEGPSTFHISMIMHDTEETPKPQVAEGTAVYGVWDEVGSLLFYFLIQPPRASSQQQHIELWGAVASNHANKRLGTKHFTTQFSKLQTQFSQEEPSFDEAKILTSTTSAITTTTNDTNTTTETTNTTTTTSVSTAAVPQTAASNALQSEASNAKTTQNQAVSDTQRDSDAISGADNYDLGTNITSSCSSSTIAVVKQDKKSDESGNIFYPIIAHGTTETGRATVANEQHVELFNPESWSVTWLFILRRGDNTKCGTIHTIATGTAQRCTSIKHDFDLNFDIDKQHQDEIKFLHGAESNEVPLNEDQDRKEELTRVTALPSFDAFSSSSFDTNAASSKVKILTKSGIVMNCFGPLFPLLVGYIICIPSHPAAISGHVQSQIDAIQKKQLGKKEKLEDINDNGKLHQDQRDTNIISNADSTPPAEDTRQDESNKNSAQGINIEAGMSTDDDAETTRRPSAVEVKLVSNECNNEPPSCSLPALPPPLNPVLTTVASPPPPPPPNTTNNSNDNTVAPPPPPPPPFPSSTDNNSINDNTDHEDTTEKETFSKK